MQTTELACSLTRPNTGRRMAIRIAMMAMTTSSSTSVKALRRCINTPDVCTPTLTCVFKLLQWAFAGQLEIEILARCELIFRRDSANLAAPLAGHVHMATCASVILIANNVRRLCWRGED